MTRIALISDIHANLEALAAVLHDAARAGVTRVACLGDIVGYGPDPGACLDLLADHASAMVMGNHDYAVVRADFRACFNERAQASIEVTRRLLGLRHRALLESLSMQHRVKSVVLTHASFGADHWEYIYTSFEAANSFAGLDGQIGAFGHTHVPGMFVAPLVPAPEAKEIRFVPLEGEATVSIPEGCRVLVNPGSVGQPRDGNPAASWGCIDLEAMTFGVRRVVYDVEKVTRKIERLGLPVVHAERLRVGA